MDRVRENGRRKDEEDEDEETEKKRKKKGTRRKGGGEREKEKGQLGKKKSELQYIKEKKWKEGEARNKGIKEGGKG